jgi:hypothetical protein
MVLTSPLGRSPRRSHRGARRRLAPTRGNRSPDPGGCARSWWPGRPVTSGWWMPVTCGRSRRSRLRRGCGAAMTMELNDRQLSIGFCSAITTPSSLAPSTRCSVAREGRCCARRFGRRRRTPTPSGGARAGGVPGLNAGAWPVPSAAAAARLVCHYNQQRPAPRPGVGGSRGGGAEVAEGEPSSGQASRCARAASSTSMTRSQHDESGFPRPTVRMRRTSRSESQRSTT